MQRNIKVSMLSECEAFIESIDPKAKEKILVNLKRLEVHQDPKLLKKLQDEIWECRTKYNKMEYRLLAFWDKRSNSETLVIATHGFVKKQWKVPANEIEKAIRIRKRYFEQH